MSLHTHPRITVPLEEARRDKLLGSSLQAAVTLPLAADERDLLSAEDWAAIAIVSAVAITDGAGAVAIAPAQGDKCARCWRVLPEVGAHPTHPTLCDRCTDAIESGLVCRAA